jgi:hypothetical protein
MSENKLRLKLKTLAISNPPLKLKTFTTEPKVIKPKTKPNKKAKPVLAKKNNLLQLLAPEIYLTILNHFKVKYPNCFSDPIKPLAIGIIKDMSKERVELKISGIKIRKFCHVYCNAPEYKAVLKQGTPRVDLLGNSTGLVEENHIQ